MSDTFPMFWVVWNPFKEMPTVRHKTFNEAVAEAKRISDHELCPNGIYVLQASFLCAKTARLELSLAERLYD
jgi:hypothetical protein